MVEVGTLLGGLLTFNLSAPFDLLAVVSWMVLVTQMVILMDMIPTCFFLGSALLHARGCVVKVSACISMEKGRRGTR